VTDELHYLFTLTEYGITAVKEVCASFYSGQDAMDIRPHMNDMRTDCLLMSRLAAQPALLTIAVNN
jgi:hypothetical protein